MNLLKGIVDFLNKIIWETPEALPWLVLLLLGTGAFLTIRLKFVQLRKFGHGVSAIFGKFDRKKDAGEVSHFQALSAALSATIGIGNIAGVATAIHYGGPGALFWMWISGFLGMASKFVECTLSLKYREIDENGEVSGGPMFYMKKGIGGIFKYIAYVFAVACVISSFGSGNSVQSFTMADSFRTDFGISAYITGGISAFLVGLVIIGGIKRIAKVASKLVPFMSGIYILGGIVVLVLNKENIVPALKEIVEGAFTPPGMIGGFAGSTFSLTLLWGIKRGLFSNEAGQGSAPIAHAAAKTEEPVREGSVAMIGPFIDTLMICTMTGLLIVTTGVWKNKFFQKQPLSVGNSITISGITLKHGEQKFLIENGKCKKITVSCNDSLVDHARFLYKDKPFSGYIVLKEKNDYYFLSRSGNKIKNKNISVFGKFSLNGSPLTAMAFKIGLAPIFDRGNLIVTIAVFLFAISTAISWSYYGDRSIKFLLGKKAVLPYRFFFVLMHFLGAIFPLEIVWGFGDFALGLMAVPNLIAIIILSGKVKKMSDNYFQKQSLKKFQSS